MDLLDLAALALLVAGLIVGFRSGAFPQLGGLLGALVGAGAALMAASTFRTEILSLDAPTRALLVIGGLVLAIVVGEVTGSTLGRAASAALGTGILSTIDRAVGGVVGLAQAVLVIWFVGSLLAWVAQDHHLAAGIALPARDMRGFGPISGAENRNPEFAILHLSWNLPSGCR